MGPMTPQSLRQEERYTGSAPASSSAPCQVDLWLFRSKRTRSPGERRALAQMRLDVDVPPSTKKHSSLPHTEAARRSALPDTPSWDEGSPMAEEESEISALNMPSPRAVVKIFPSSVRLKSFRCGGRGCQNHSVFSCLCQEGSREGGKRFYFILIFFI